MAVVAKAAAVSGKNKSMTTLSKPMRAAAARLARINALLAKQETVERICATLPDDERMMITKRKVVCV